MRESNFSSQGRAAVCISAVLYDRRAIDAPSPSLPLINSLTHLTLLTATSPRIREILALDGGLERLVRILKGCAAGGPTLIEDNLATLKGQGANLAPGPRRSPFRPFSEYPRQSLPEAIPSLIPLPSTLSKHLLYTYTLAFQCLVNIGVRGSEMIRTRVVEAGALDVVVHVLERYLQEIERRKSQAEIDYCARESTSICHGMEVIDTIILSSRPTLSRLDTTTEDLDLALLPPTRVSTPISAMDEGCSVADESASSSGQEADGDGDGTEAHERVSSALSQNTRRARASTIGSKINTIDVEEESTPAIIDIDGDISMEDPQAQPTPRAAIPSHLAPAPPRSEKGLQYRDEDVLASLQLLAYLSKYPHVRSVFHSPADEAALALDEPMHDHIECGLECTAASLPRHASGSADAPPQLDVHLSTPTLSSNVFSLVESFTHRPPSSDRFTPRHSNEVQYWAGVIMRNACRKDESRGGIRQCANMQCGVWEKFPREFAKCRRCRKAKYCSKNCQSQAWQLGHRYWCAKAQPKDVLEAEGAPEGRDNADATASSSATIRLLTQVPSAGPARQPRLARPSHHAHLASNPSSRPSTANSLDTEEEEDELRLPPSTALSSNGNRSRAPHRHSNPTLPRGLEVFAPPGHGMGPPEETMDENELAQELFVGGRVFGGINGAVGVVEPFEA